MWPKTVALALAAKPCKNSGSALQGADPLFNSTGVDYMVGQIYETQIIKNSVHLKLSETVDQ